jgi:Ras-related protein Rab-21
MRELESFRDLPTYKVVLLGDSRVGKTSIITRQVLGYQSETQNPTIGCHCSDIRFVVNGQEIALQVWDTAGQEMYRSLVPVYLRGARAALLVYDVTDRDSFESLGHWHDILVEVVPSDVTIYIVGNKVDLEESAVIDDIQAKQFAEVHNAHFFKVSAETGQGLELLFEQIANKMLECLQIKESAANDPIPQTDRHSCGCSL